MSKDIQVVIIKFAIIHVDHAVFMVRSDGVIYVGGEQNWSKVQECNITAQARDFLLDNANIAFVNGV